MGIFFGRTGVTGRCKAGPATLPRGGFLRHVFRFAAIGPGHHIVIEKKTYPHTPHFIECKVRANRIHIMGCRHGDPLMEREPSLSSRDVCASLQLIQGLVDQVIELIKLRVGHTLVPERL